MTPESIIYPTVSIVIAVFNCDQYIKKTIESILEQSYHNFELIIYDDASTDNTSNIIKQLAEADGRISYCRGETNLGPSFGRNHGIKLARGKYLAFCDGDDIWHPDKLNIQIYYMNKLNLAFSFTDYRHMSQDGSLMGNLIQSPHSQVSRSMHHIRRDIAFFTVMLDRSQIGNFEFITPDVNGEDFVAWSILLSRVDSAYRVPHDLGRYRLLEKSRSSNKLKKIKSVFNIYRDILRFNPSRLVFTWSLYIYNSFTKHYNSRPKEANLWGAFPENIKTIKK